MSRWIEAISRVRGSHIVKPAIFSVQDDAKGIHRHIVAGLDKRSFVRGYEGLLVSAHFQRQTICLVDGGDGFQNESAHPRLEHQPYGG